MKTINIKLLQTVQGQVLGDPYEKFWKKNFYDDLIDFKKIIESK